MEERLIISRTVWSSSKQECRAHLARSVSLLTDDLVDSLLFVLFGGIQPHQPVLVHKDAFAVDGKDRVGAWIRRADRERTYDARGYHSRFDR